MTFTQLYQDLPFLAFGLVVVYTFLGIVRMKRFLRIPFILLIVIMGCVPGIWFVLPVFAIFELTMQIMRIISPYLNRIL